MQRLKIIKEISKSMKSLKGVETYLYGSEARGDANASSDIDLLILLPDTITTAERIDMELAIHGLLLPIEINNNTEISPLILQQKVWKSRKTPFTINVLNDRIRI